MVKVIWLRSLERFDNLVLERLKKLRGSMGFEFRCDDLYFQTLQCFLPPHALPN